RTPSLHALGRRREAVGAVAPDLPLVDEAREPAGAGKHAEERHLGERDRRRTVVDEQDLVAGERQLVAAARGRPVERGERPDAGLGAHLLEVEAGLVVNLQKLTLNGCELEASMKMLAPAQNMRSRSEVTTSAWPPGREKRRRWTASASSMSTPRS